MAFQMMRKTATLSRRILQALLDRGMCQSDVAQIIGANRSHLTRVKNGEHEFTDSQLEQIERSLLIPLGMLLLGSAPSPDAPAKVRQLHKEAAQLVMKSAALRAKM
jgi:ribosome-binding protein aMBF1 (putative translation factor)